jgi:hypothetical protein
MKNARWLWLLGAMACSRNDVEAANLAQEGDKALKNDLDGAISKYEQATKLPTTCCFTNLQ